MSKFEKLKSILTEKGAKSPGGLAAYISRKKYGSKATALAAKNHIPAATAKRELKKK